MANDEHVALLEEGAAAWNAWRDQNADIQPNLSAAYLSGAKLSGAKLSGAKLTWVNLSEADLSEANLMEADLREANLTGANLSKADFTGANLTGANVSGASLYITVFGNTTLREVKGLDQFRHLGPSVIDFLTLEKSDPLPVAFLRGVGLPNAVIESLLAVQHYSCFISFSSKDQAFADRLHADLQNNGVRCWFAPRDMSIGAKIIDSIDEAIRLRDKVLLILSEGAIASDWVEGEVTRALEEERTRKQVVLFPVRLDDTVMQTSEGWARLLRGQRNIGDFTRWKEHDSYQRSFERLMRDLRVKQDSSAPETI
jgi:TIR domain/Pentapeptide repeats (8 copies)